MLKLLQLDNEILTKSLDRDLVKLLYFLLIINRPLQCDQLPILEILHQSIPYFLVPLVFTFGEIADPTLQVLVLGKLSPIFPHLKDEISEHPCEPRLRYPLFLTDHGIFPLSSLSEEHGG